MPTDGPADPAARRPAPARVVPLAERPDLLDQVARWGFAEWGHLRPGGDSLEARRERVRATLRQRAIPMTFVALGGQGEAIGTAALILDDIEGDPRNPWLASVYVPPEARRRGIASALVQAVERAAADLGHDRLYLFTASAPELYAGLGWRALERRDYRGESILVMDRGLNSPAG